MHAPARQGAERAAAGPAALLAAFALLATGGGCSREARAVRVAHEGRSEVYRISCAKDIQPCRDKAESLCGGRYETLEASGAPIEPPRITSAPGPRSTGSRYQRPEWVGTLVVACTSSEGEPMSTAAREREDESAPEPAPPVLPPGMLCIPGATQLCLGAGACRGAQACLPDGRGYGPCDCGRAEPSRGAEPSATPSDAGAPVMGSTP